MIKRNNNESKCLLKKDCCSETIVDASKFFNAALIDFKGAHEWIISSAIFNTEWMFCLDLCAFIHCIDKVFEAITICFSLSIIEWGDINIGITFSTCSEFFNGNIEFSSAYFPTFSTCASWKDSFVTFFGKGNSDKGKEFHFFDSF